MARGAAVAVGQISPDESPALEMRSAEIEMRSPRTSADLGTSEAARSLRSPKGVACPLSDADEIVISEVGGDGSGGGGGGGGGGAAVASDHASELVATALAEAGGSILMSSVPNPSPSPSPSPSPNPNPPHALTFSCNPKRPRLQPDEPTRQCYVPMPMRRPYGSVRWHHARR